MRHRLLHGPVTISLSLSLCKEHMDPEQILNNIGVLFTLSENNIL